MPPIWHSLTITLTLICCCLAQSSPEAQPGTSAAASQSQLNDIERLRTRFTAALAQMGEPAAPAAPGGAGGPAVTQVMTDLIAESAALAKNLKQPRDQLLATHIQLQARYALAQLARQRDDLRESGYQVGQLRTSAMRTKQIAAPGASTHGDFWLLQADLFDINSTGMNIDARQQQAIDRFEAFLVTRKPDAAGQSTNTDVRTILRDVKLALLSLYDQRGQSDKAFTLFDQIRTAPDTDAAMQDHLERAYGYCNVLHKPWSVTLTTRDGKTWSSAAHRGKVILIHFFADWYSPSVEAFKPLREVYDRLHPRGLEVLSVTLNPRKSGPQKTSDVKADIGGKDQSPRVPDSAVWPIYFQTGDQGVNLYQVFSVGSLPRYVLVDREGRIEAVGASLVVLDRIEAMLAPAQGPKPAASTPSN